MIRIPLTHSSLKKKLNLKEDSRHILFSGTQVIQKRSADNEKIRAVVIRTGFNTTKGELIRSILHPKPVDFEFNRDTYKYIGVLSVIALAGMIYSLVLKIQSNNPYDEIIKRTLDVVTIVVPPALPGALTACLVYAQVRLRKRGIFCISPSSINICGTLNTFVFDKTGTLTEDGLDLKFVVPVKTASSSSKREFSTLITKVRELDKSNHEGELIDKAMATCHSLTYIYGEIAGDPLELKMFDFVNWKLIGLFKNHIYTVTAYVLKAGGDPSIRNPINPKILL